jgi:hypothetical protein
MIRYDYIFEGLLPNKWWFALVVLLNSLLVVLTQTAFKVLGRLYFTCLIMAGFLLLQLWVSPYKSKSLLHANISLSSCLLLIAILWTAFVDYSTLDADEQSGFTSTAGTIVFLSIALAVVFAVEVYSKYVLDKFRSIGMSPHIHERRNLAHFHDVIARMLTEPSIDVLKRLQRLTGPEIGTITDTAWLLESHLYGSQPPWQRFRQRVSVDNQLMTGDADVHLGIIASSPTLEEVEVEHLQLRVMLHEFKSKLLKFDPSRTPSTLTAIGSQSNSDEVTLATAMRALEGSVQHSARSLQDLPHQDSRVQNLVRSWVSNPLQTALSACSKSSDARSSSEMLKQLKVIGISAGAHLTADEFSDLLGRLDLDSKTVLASGRLFELIDGRSRGQVSVDDIIGALLYLSAPLSSLPQGRPVVASATMPSTTSSSSLNADNQADIQEALGEQHTRMQM